MPQPHRIARVASLGAACALLLPAMIACSGGDPGVNIDRRMRDAGTAPLPAAPSQPEADAGDVAVETPAPVVDAGTPPSPVDAAPETAPAALTCIACINTGGGAYTSPSGRVFAADNGSDGDATFSNTNAISGTTDATLYQSERYGQTFAYALPVPNGTYTLNLHFAEIYWTAVGQRVFNVDVQGARALDAFDIVKDAGAANAAVVKSFPVTVSDGTVKIAFSTVTDAAKISAIELLGR